MATLNDPLPDSLGHLDFTPTPVGLAIGQFTIWLLTTFQALKFSLG